MCHRSCNNVVGSSVVLMMISQSVQGRQCLEEQIAIIPLFIHSQQPAKEVYIHLRWQSVFGRTNSFCCTVHSSAVAWEGSMYSSQMAIRSMISMRQLALQQVIVKCKMIKHDGGNFVRISKHQMLGLHIVHLQQADVRL